MDDFPGIDGFLGTRASLMLDVLFLAMFVIVAVLAWSVFQVKYRRRYSLHKRVQVILGVVLLIAVALFEVDIQTHGWEDRAAGQVGGPVDAIVRNALAVHLVFAISSAALWPIVIILALRRFPNPPAPGAHSKFHLSWARLAAFDMLLTAVIGWIFYWLAFVR